jgi:EF-hand domain pair/EF hand
MGAKEPCMVRPTVVVLFLLSLAAAAYADPENVRKWQSQVEFRSAAAKTEGGASGGSTAARSAPASEKEAMFRALDIDGDGFVSKAEAAGHEKVMLGFDRADRNRDGKLSFAEYDSIGKPRPARKNVAKGKSAEPAGSASAGSTKKAN